MASPPGSSTPSADLPPGTRLGDFRLERVIGRGPRATVYAATQLGLARRVAVKVLRDRALADRVRRLTWPEHPGAVTLFATGDSEHGPWLAMRLVAGGTLETANAALDDVAAALAEAHAAGLVHGAVTARNVLVADGRAALSDFGLAPGRPTAVDDLAALAGLVRDHPPPRWRSRRRPLALAGTGASLVGVGLAVALTAGGGGAASAPTPPAGTRPIGSDLAPGDVVSVDCSGAPASGASRPCTVSQLALAGRETVVRRAGTITSWAVRGARGSLALQVLRADAGTISVVAESPDEVVPGPQLRVVASDLAVAPGDRIALLVAPGAAVGVRRAGPRASTERWFGPLLGFPPPRPPDRPAGSGFDHELLLRADVSPDAEVDTVAPLRGGGAAGAPPGRLLATRDVEVGGGERRTVAVVVLGSAVAVDLLDGTRRLARTPLAGADGRGRFVALAATGAGTVRVRWRNSDGARLDEAIEVTATGLG